MTKYIEYFQVEAKCLLKDFKKNLPEAKSRCEKYFSGKSELSLMNAQHVIAKEYGFDSWNDLIILIFLFRCYTNDDIVIYTGYNESEVSEQIERLRYFKNIIIKFGRYIPNKQSHYDNVLGVNLASDNQYAIKIS